MKGYQPLNKDDDYVSYESELCNYIKIKSDTRKFLRFVAWVWAPKQDYILCFIDTADINKTKLI